jgi:hypothetical protein
MWGDWYLRFGVTGRKQVPPERWYVPTSLHTVIHEDCEDWKYTDIFGTAISWQIKKTGGCHGGPEARTVIGDTNLKIPLPRT